MECLKERINFTRNMVELFEIREINEGVLIKRRRHIASSLLVLEVNPDYFLPPRDLLYRKE